MSPLRQETSYLKGAAYAIAAVTIWAGWMAITRHGVTTSLNAWDIAALRFAVAGLVLLPVVLRRGIGKHELGWPGLLLLISGAGAPYALVSATGLRFAPAADAGVLIPGVMPLFVAGLAMTFLGERFARIRKIGYCLIGLGALTMVGVGALAFDSLRSLGHAFFLAAAFLWATFTIVLRRARLDAWHGAGLVAVGSLVGYVPVYFVFFGTKLLSAPFTEVAAQGIYQGLFATVISLYFYGRAVSILGASGASAFGALVPALAAVLAIVFLGEFPTGVDWLGIVLVSAGVYLASGAPLPRGLVSRVGL
jgi:drug/metabolite transporter (DMT)-like permease